MSLTKFSIILSYYLNKSCSTYTYYQTSSHSHKRTQTGNKVFIIVFYIDTHIRFKVFSCIPLYHDKLSPREFVCNKKNKIQFILYCLLFAIPLHPESLRQGMSGGFAFINYIITN